MRSLLTLLVVLGLGYYVLRSCGYIHHGDAKANADGAKGAGEAIESPESGSGAVGNEGGGGVQGAPDSSTPTPTTNGAPPAAPRTTLSPALLAIAKKVADGAPAGEQTAALDALAKDTGDPAAAAIVAQLKLAAGDKPAERWRALSALAGDPSFEPELASQFASRATAVARDGVIARSSVRYKVVKGDSLDKIAKKLGKDKTVNLTAGMLRWVNGITGDRIKPGMDLVVPTDPIRIVVSKSRYTLRAFLGDSLIREFRCAIGRDDKTPVANFEIETKLVKPPWDEPSTGKRLHFSDPGYPLGTRWLAFKAAEGRSGLGIHGTDDPNSIGTKASLGCVRLKNENVEDLFELVPVGAPVSIQN